MKHMKNMTFSSAASSLLKTLCVGLVLLCSPLMSFAQTTVTGQITDEAGVAVPGATVSVSGTTNGAVSDANGKYSISGVPANAALTFSCIGYLTQEISVSNRSVINVALIEDIELIEEVVVVGYGVQKKENLSGAVAYVGGDVLENRPIASIGEGLQGVIPNLQITQGSFRLGAGANYNVRGTTSLNGGGPLILVDGVVMDPNLVNPNDIESVTVLKDAAASAIYGARAAYGVILMTTKKGKEGAPVVSFSAQVSTGMPTYLPHELDSWTYVNYMNLINRNAGGSNFFDDRLMQYTKNYYFDPENNPDWFFDPAIETDGYYKFCGNTDWADVMYKNSSMQQYGANLRGGTDKVKYYASYGYMDQKGFTKGFDDKYKRHTFTMDITSDVASWITVGAKVKYTHTDTNTPVENSWKLKTFTEVFPLLPIYLPDSENYPKGSYAVHANWDNPLASLTGGSSKTQINDMWLTGTLVLRPAKGWTINADYTYNAYGRNLQNAVQKIYEYKPDGSFWLYPHTSTNSAEQQNNNDYYNALNVYTDYTLSLGKNNFKVMVGYNQEVKTTNYFKAKRKELIDNEKPIIDLATGDMSVGGNQSSWAVQGIFARFNYNYDEKYFLEMNGRYDGTSKFAPGNRFAFFPSVSAAWRIGKEDFMESVDWLDELKIRGSYGNLGNQAVGGDFPYLATYGINTSQDYLLGGSKGVAISAPGLVSSNFTWETVTQWNAGLDYAFLGNRLSGGFDIYTRYTKGMLTSGQPLPGVLGTGVPNENAADLKTQGWEFSLEWKDNIDDFQYGAKFVLSDSRTFITRFENPTKQIGKHYVGEELGEIWGFHADGLFLSQSELDNAPDMTAINGTPRNLGDVYFKDVNGDGKVNYGDNTVDNPGDRSIIGNNSPRYQYGINLNAAWKGFDLTLFFQGVGKRDIFPNSKYFGASGEWDLALNDNLDFYREADEFWDANTTTAVLPRPYINGDHGNRTTSDLYLQNAAYLRLKQLSFGYTLPKSFLNKIKISSARVYFTGQNLLTFTKLSKIFDPEVYNGGVVYALDNGGYPVSKQYTFGINISF